MRQTVESFRIAGRTLVADRPASVKGRNTNGNRRRVRRQGRRLEGQKRQGQKGKEKRKDSTTKASTRSARSSRALVVTAGNGDTSNEALQEHSN